MGTAWSTTTVDYISMGQIMKNAYDGGCVTRALDEGHSHPSKCSVMKKCFFIYHTVQIIFAKMSRLPSPNQ